MRERLGSRLGFILLSAGCAIGLGNIWRFPYVAGQNGGGLFVLLYLFFLAALALPVLVMEFAAGRAAQRSIAGIHAALTPERSPWRLHGLAGVLGCTLLMSFYTTVTGWMLIYFFKTAAGDFAGLGPQEIGGAFGRMLGSAPLQSGATLAVVLGSAGILAIGLQKGLERVTKWMMAALLVLILVLAGNSLRLDGALEGVRFYLVPSLANMQKAGVAKVVVEAMNQAFFTLSLGIGSMAIFGSYIERRRTLLGEALNVAALDTFVALSAGLIILPACAAFGVPQGSGPGLIFVTLPNVFNQMPAGRLWGSLFFLFMSCAALTTVLAVFECIVAGIRDYTRWNRPKACAVLAATVSVTSLPCILGFNAWSAFKPFGEGSCVLDLEDFVVSNFLLPLGGLCFALYCTRRFGWGWTKFVDEANAGTGPRLPTGRAGALLHAYCAYVLPVVILAVFVLGLLAKFKVLTW